VLDIAPPSTDNDKDVIKVILRARGSSERRSRESKCWPLSGQRKKYARALLGFFGPLVGVPDDEQCGDN